MLPKDRTCPMCGEVVVNSRRWVVKDNIVQCLKCYRKRNKK